MVETPLRPARRPSQVVATSAPSGVVAPMPVMTTPWPVLLTRCLSGVCGDVVDGVLDGGELGQLVVGDLDAELVLGLHGDLHHRQRVDVEVVDERLLRGDLRGVDA